MTDFITTTELGDYLGRTLTADAGAALAVTMASDVCRTLTAQDFVPVTTDTVKLDGTGTDTLLLPQVPVTAAGTVVVNGGTLSGTLDYVATSDGLLVRTDGTATLSSWSQSGYGPCAYWPQGRQNVSVTYTHGGTAAPDDVKMVALMIASRLVVQGVDAQRQVGQANVRYAVSSSDLTNGEKAILAKYRRAR